jgi:hypothetical protein
MVMAVVMMAVVMNNGISDFFVLLFFNNLFVLVVVGFDWGNDELFFIFFLCWGFDELFFLFFLCWGSDRFISGFQENLPFTEAEDLISINVNTAEAGSQLALSGAAVMALHEGSEGSRVDLAFAFFVNSVESSLGGVIRPEL